VPTLFQSVCLLPEQSVLSILPTHHCSLYVTQCFVHCAGCDAYTVWMPSGGLLCPRWCITFKDGKSTGRTGCFGVVWYDEVQPTVSLPLFF